MKYSNKDKNDVIIIGTGTAGLACAYSLKHSGLNTRILEQASHVADAWRRRHPQLRLNTHRAISSLPGMRLPKSDGAYLKRNTVIRYLEDYASQIDSPVDFEVTVQSIERVDESWRLITDHGDYWARHVVVATGYDRLPYIPQTPDINRFQGKVRHAADFGELSDYYNKKILVIGCGNSGTDILNHLATITTDQVWVSVRHGPVIFPTRLFGIPVQLLSPVLEKLPVKAVDVLLTLTEQIAFGMLSRYGMKKHIDGGATRLLRDGVAPAIDNGFVHALKKGRIEVLPEAVGYHETSVSFANGKQIEPDIVLFATGYKTGLKKMLGDIDLLDQSGVPTIHGSEQDTRYPGLWFTGMRPMLSGFFRAAGQTGNSIASAICVCENQQIFDTEPGQTHCLSGANELENSSNSGAEIPKIKVHY